MNGEYAVYLRKSRADVEAERRGEGETLARHERALRALAERQGLRLSAVYREIGSGDAVASRPLMRRLLDEVERGRWEGVLVMEVERLARGDAMDQGLVARAFRLSGTRIVTPCRTYDPGNEADEEYFEFGLFMSRREYKAIRRRLQRGREASVREGKYVGSAPPYGYDRKKLDNEKGWILVPNPEQAPMVRLMFALYAYGERTPEGTLERPGVGGIARRLDGLCRPPKGDAWSPGSVREMLRNPVYMGCLRWNWRKERRRREDGRTVVSRPRSTDGLLLSPGRHEAIVTRELFDAVQERLQARSTPRVRGRGAVRNPLAGLVVCGECGRRMQRRPYGKQGASTSLICTSAACGNVGADLSLVEARLASALDIWLGARRLSRTARAGDDASDAARRKAVERLGREIRTLEAQRAALHDLLEQGVYSAETFQERAAALGERLRKAERERDALTQEASPEPPDGTAVREGRLPEVCRGLTPGERNAFFKSVVEKVVYRKELQSRRSRPDAFTLDIYPKIGPYVETSRASERILPCLYQSEGPSTPDRA